MFIDVVTVLLLLCMGIVVPVCIMRSITFNTIHISASDKAALMFELLMFKLDILMIDRLASINVSPVNLAIIEDVIEQCSNINKFRPQEDAETQLTMSTHIHVYKHTLTVILGDATYSRMVKGKLLRMFLKHAELCNLPVERVACMTSA